MNGVGLSDGSNLQDNSQQRIGDESLASLNHNAVEVPMHVYRPPSALRNSLDVQFSPDGEKIYSTNNFGGSVQTVYTLASDV
uniref:Uncharacterized protein n=1 Tax=Plectus sambesii TaxID=2011161 RepID=A0A914XNJ6_9BILA